MAHGLLEQSSIPREKEFISIIWRSASLPNPGACCCSLWAEQWNPIAQGDRGTRWKGRAHDTPAPFHFTSAEGLGATPRAVVPAGTRLRARQPEAGVADKVNLVPHPQAPAQHPSIQGHCQLRTDLCGQTDTGGDGHCQPGANPSLTGSWRSLVQAVCVGPGIRAGPMGVSPMVVTSQDYRCVWWPVSGGGSGGWKAGAGAPVCPAGGQPPVPVAASASASPH